MTDTNPRLEAELARLRAAGPSQAAEQIIAGIERRVRARQRQLAGAAAGALISIIAAVVLILRSEPMGWFAMPAIAAVFVYVVVRSSRSANRLASLESGKSLLEGWRNELVTELAHTRQALIVAGLFIGLTVWVMVNHGVASGRGLFYGITAVAIGAFAIYQWLVVRPATQRELDTLGTDD